MLIRALPYESILWTQVREAEEKALTSLDRLRARQAHYADKKEAADE